ncbi:MAG: hypothetical protein LBH17_07485, partial [Oscillospiraceae bacterium]|nr:hypothetical protein [Oscillospiraceae bacterium]
QVTEEYIYDATNRLSVGANSKGETSAYIYNGLGYRIGNTITRANPNYAYQNSANAGGSDSVGSVEDIIE